MNKKRGTKMHISLSVVLLALSMFTIVYPLARDTIHIINYYQDEKDIMSIAGITDIGSMLILLTIALGGSIITAKLISPWVAGFIFII